MPFQALELAFSIAGRASTGVIRPLGGGFGVKSVVEADGVVSMVKVLLGDRLSASIATHSCLRREFQNYRENGEQSDKDGNPFPVTVNVFVNRRFYLSYFPVHLLGHAANVGNVVSAIRFQGGNLSVMFLKSRPNPAFELLELSLELANGRGEDFNLARQTADQPPERFPCCIVVR